MKEVITPPLEEIGDPKSVDDPFTSDITLFETEG
jgi:hypothetical protein